MNRVLLCAVHLVMASCICHAQVKSGPAIGRYSIVDIGTLGGKKSWANCVNDRGQVVGSALTIEGVSHAFLYERGTIKQLDDAGRFGCQALGINRQGQVVGAVSVTLKSNEVTFVGFVYRNGKLKRMGTLGGTSSWVYAVNDKGVAIGDAYDAHHYKHAVIFHNGKARDLGTFGGAQGEANGINAQGDVVGGADTARSDTHAFLLSHSRMADLGTLGGRVSHAYGVNSARLVVGSAQLRNGYYHAFEYKTGKMHDIGTLGGEESQAASVNRTGTIVGTSDMPDGTRRAFKYERGVMRDLNTAIDRREGWTLTNALSISDNGYIVGVGVHNGLEHGYLLSPVIPKAARHN